INQHHTLKPSGSTNSFWDVLTSAVFLSRKSTFFNVLTKSQAAAENFPFCTIDPNESRVPIPDERYDFLCQFHKPVSKVPVFLNVVDIAGLVKGAHAGPGLGNAFLSHISACDGILHMTRESHLPGYSTLHITV
uniref:OBG-type G domain-containing protein n=1 Tax=Hucho hucho TaxID=62062 RepID=A0A4W5L084_9TELE